MLPTLQTCTQCVQLEAANDDMFEFVSHLPFLWTKIKANYQAIDTKAMKTLLPFGECF